MEKNWLGVQAYLYRKTTLCSWVTRSFTMTRIQSRAHNDFRSDTFTTPTPNMVAAMTNATLGDSVYEEDEDTAAFEEKVAKLAGMERGTFVVSGTMSNQLALRAHLHQPPHSVLCDHRGHIFTSEAAGLAILSQTMVTPVVPKNGIYLTLEDVKSKVILGKNIHTAPTKVISLENTLGGTIMPIEEIARISEWARQNDIKMHLDGARLWNASIATGVSLAEYGKYFDSISLCISKGLCAPVGSVLVGGNDYIEKVLWLKKQQGGGIRQAGLLTAAANVALDEVWPTMATTHQKTAQLAKDLEAMGVMSEVPVQTNFIFLDAQTANLDLDILAQEAAKHNVKVMANRIVLHYHITDESIENLKNAVKSALTLSKQKAATEKLNVSTGYGSMR